MTAPRKLLALALAVTLFTVRIGSFSPQVIAEKIQHFVSVASTLCEEQAETKFPYCKIKRAALDADTAARDTVCLSLSPPLAATPESPPAQFTLPGISPEIFIPPEGFSPC